MAAVDTTSRPAITSPLAETDEKAKRQDEENVKNQKLDNLARREASNEKVYRALENYLLTDPERQIPQLGGIEGQLEGAEVAKNAGNKEVVRGSYEIAAKIEIYKKDKESARKNIGLAEQFTDPNDVEHHDIHEILLSHMDEVMKISSDYYTNLSHQK